MVPDSIAMSDGDRTSDRYQVKAFNTATASQNKMHSDEVASTYGFTGGLVPGVDVYAYLTHLPAARWGLDWLRSGAMEARFRTPVYDGDLVTVEATTGGGGSLELELRDSRGNVCATGLATPPGARPAEEWVPLETLPLADPPPPASPTTLAKGTTLGVFAGGFRAEHAPTYLAEVRDELGLYTEEQVAHPGWLLRFANWVLSYNVALGPWIHVGSKVTMLDVVGNGERVEARAVVTDEYERSGHRFVVLDVAITADGRPVQRVEHTSIYEPRKGPKPT